MIDLKACTSNEWLLGVFEWSDGKTPKELRNGLQIIVDRVQADVVGDWSAAYEYLFTHERLFNCIGRPQETILRQAALQEIKTWLKTKE